MLRRFLLHRCYAGQVSGAIKRNPRPPVFGLTVPLSLARGEWNAWTPEGPMTEEAFSDRLKVLHIAPFR